MSIQKVSYTKLLKEALTGDLESNDITKTVDVTGPMTKQILGYRGDGELKTSSDAASILERYYFGGDDSKVSVLGEDDKRSDFAEPDRNDVSDVPDKNVGKTKKDIEKAVTEQDEDDDPKKDADDVNDKDDLSEAEEAVIEKLIAEMEDEDVDDVDIDVKKEQDELEDDPDSSDELDVKKEQDELEDDKKIDEIGPLDNPKPAEDDELQEAFKIFREEVESEEEEEEEGEEDKKKPVEKIDSDDITV